MSLAWSPQSGQSLHMINVANPRTKQHRPQSWKQHENRLRQLYSTTRLEDIQRLMVTEHGFHATVAQYKYQFQKWRLNKYNTARRASSSLEISEKSTNAPLTPEANKGGFISSSVSACPRPRISIVENHNAAPDSGSAHPRRPISIVESHNPAPSAKRQRLCNDSNAVEGNEGSKSLFEHSPDDLTGLPPCSKDNLPASTAGGRVGRAGHFEWLDADDDLINYQNLDAGFATPSLMPHSWVDEAFTTVAWNDEHDEPSTETVAQHEIHDTAIEIENLEQQCNRRERSQTVLVEKFSEDRPPSPTPLITAADSIDTTNHCTEKIHFEEPLRPLAHDVLLSRRVYLVWQNCKLRGFLTEISTFSRQAIELEMTLKTSSHEYAYAPSLVDNILIDTFQRMIIYTWPQMKRIVAAADLCFSLDLCGEAFLLYSAILRSPHCVDLLGKTSITQVLMDWALSAQTPHQARFAKDHIREYIGMYQSLGKIGAVLEVILTYLDERSQDCNSGDRFYAVSWVRAFRLKHFGPLTLDLVRSSPAFLNFFQVRPLDVSATPLEVITTLSKMQCSRNMLRRCKQNLSTVQARAPIVSLQRCFERSVDDDVVAASPLELLLWIRDLGFNWGKPRECECIHLSRTEWCIWDGFSWAELQVVMCRMLYSICRPGKTPQGRIHTSELLVAFDATIQYPDEELAGLVMKAIIEGKGSTPTASDFAEFGNFVLGLIEQVLGIYLPPLNMRQHSLSLANRRRESVVSRASATASSTHSSTYLSFRRTAQRLAESTPRSPARLGLPSSVISPSLLSRSSLLSISELSDRLGRTLSISTHADSESIRSGDRQSSSRDSQDTQGSRLLSSLRSVRGIKA